MEEQPFFTAYLSADGKHVTDFNGKIVGKVLYYSTIPLTRPSSVHGSTIRAARVIDFCCNKEWYGRSSPGIFIKLRLAKLPRGNKNE